MRSEGTMLHEALREEVDAQLVRLDLFLQLLDTLFQQSAPYASSVPLTLLAASILKVRQSGRAVKLLAEEGMVEEILAIGRTLVEVTVNVTYLQNAGEKELARYLSFHPELLHKQMGSLQPPHGRSSARRFMRKLGDAVSTLTTAGKAQQTTVSWTNRTLVERAQLADERTDIPVMGLLVNRCYPRGDAAAHGTVGALASFVEAVPSREMLLREYRFSDLSQAIFGINLTLMSFSLFLNEFFHLGMDEAMARISAADSSTKLSLEGK